MTLLGLCITLVVVGVLLWLVVTYIPMQSTIKRILVAVVVIATVIYVLNAFGVFRTGRISGQRVPQLGGSCSVLHVGAR